MAKVIILNGAPGCGKDTLTNIICDMMMWEKQSFKRPMFDLAESMLGWRVYEQFIQDYEDRKTKEKPRDYLNGLTCREFMIWISEEVIKPMFGNRHFGKLASESILKADPEGYKTFVFSDGGFYDEVAQLAKDGHSISLFRLHREGFTFEGDSRSHIYLHPKYGVAEFDVFISEGCQYQNAHEIIALARPDLKSHGDNLSDVKW